MIYVATPDNTPELEVKHEHPHSEVCESFKLALEYGHLIVIEGEIQIQGRLPKGAKTGNIITGEKYDPEQFHFNIAITYCPFCGQPIKKKRR